MSPTHTAKQTYLCGKRDLQHRQKKKAGTSVAGTKKCVFVSGAHTAKQTYLCGKRDLQHRLTWRDDTRGTYPSSLFAREVEK